MSTADLRLGVLASHPIQYQAPLFRELGRRCRLQVFFAHRQSPQQQAQAGFGVAFDWDLDLLAGYESRFLENRARRPGVSSFFGCDTPQIREFIRAGQFDAFLVTGWHLRTYWQALMACRRVGVPVMVRGDSQLGTPRGAFKRLLKEILYPIGLRKFHACLYVGQRNHDYLRHYGVPEDHLFFAPHCVDTERFSMAASALDRETARRRLGATEGQKVVLYVGKLLAVKRPSDLLQALKIVRELGLDVRGVFAGSGAIQPQLVRQAKELNVDVTWFGFQNQTALPEVYVGADVTVLPSSSETWGLVVNESLACGTPVVVSDAVGCAPDLVLEGETGALYPMGDVNALAEAIVRALRIPRNSSAICAKSAAYSIDAAASGILHAAVSVSGRNKEGQVPFQ